MNPYSGATLATFYGTFLSRFAAMVQGAFAPDEVQLLSLAAISISASLVGSFLLFRRMTMLANSLSHTILLGIVVAFLIEAPSGGQLPLPLLLIASLVTACITVAVTYGVTRLLKVQEDASIGLVFTALFALGVVLVTLYTRSTHFGIEAIMGNVDALTRGDLQMSALVMGGVTLITFIAFRMLFVTTFDATLAYTAGLSSLGAAALLLTETSVVAVTAFRAVGLFLFLSLLVGPPIIARACTNSFRKLLIIAPAIGLSISTLAVALSRHVLTVHKVPLSTSGLTATLIGLVAFISLWAPKVRRKSRSSV
jgi:manganese/zinc/iron transport system permease protein